MIEWGSVSDEVWKALLTGVVAPSFLLLGQYLIRHFRRPKLQIDVPSGPGCRIVQQVKGENGDLVSRVWLRVRVRNCGWRTASRCQVFLTRYGPPRQRVLGAVEDFDLAPLIWAHTEHVEEAMRVVVDLPPKTHRFVDVVLGYDLLNVAFSLAEAVDMLNLRSPNVDTGFQSIAAENDGLALELLVVDAEGRKNSRIVRFAWDGTVSGLRWLDKENLR